MSEEQQLRLLAIFHYVVGGLAALFACLPLIHFALGIAMVFWPHAFGGQQNQSPPPFVGWIFIVLGGGMFLFGQALAACMIVTGRFLIRRTHYLFVFVVACCECVFMPFGTVLGVFTIIVLSKEPVKALFTSAQRDSFPTASSTV